MEDKNKNHWFKFYLCIVLGFGLLLAFWYVASYSKSSIPQRTFQVSGEGRVIALPDIAEISFGVITEGGKNIFNLQKENSAKVNQILSFLKENGVEEKDIKTQFYNINPRYQYFSCPVREEKIISCPPSEIIGYTINQNILVKVRDLNKASGFLSGIVERGANNVSGISFSVDDPIKFQNQAREKAIAQAREKAEAIAKAGGFRLGKLIAINEGVMIPSPIPLEQISVIKSEEPGEKVEIEPGSQEIRINVTLTYEIK